MPRLTRAQEEARQRIAGLAERGWPPERLAAGVLAAVLRAVPADGAGLAGIDPTTLLYNRLLAATPGYQPSAQHYLSRVYLTDPIITLTPPGMMRARILVLVVSDRLDPALGIPPVTLDQLSSRAQVDAFRAIPGPPGGVLRAMFPANGRWVAGLEAVRFDPGRPFDSRDVAFIRLLAPVIGRALGVACDRELALLQGQVAVKETPPSGILLLKANGQVGFQTPPTEGWLRALRATEGGGTRLPLVVWSARAGLRAGVGGMDGTVVRVATPEGALRIEATASDADGGVAIVLTPEHPPALPVPSAAWDLTTREGQIVGLLLCGASNRQLARAMCVSENTVETHLRHIYEKVGVRGRSQVVARFFRETYSMALLGPNLPLEDGNQ